MIAFAASSPIANSFTAQKRANVTHLDTRKPRHHARVALCARLDNRIGKPSVGVDVIPSWDTLSSTEFDTLFSSGELSMCLVGMSNCGKSHWSGKLAEEYGFQRLCVDDEIEQSIEPELSALGYAGIADMARWMGYPSDERYAKNEARYLEIEEQVTSQVTPSGSNFVLDTTGSVVYLTPSTLELLRRKFLIVHLAADESVLDDIRRSYFENPKPVVWSDVYNQLANESPDGALRRCYEHLLRERLRRYHSLAHVSVPAAFGFSPSARVEQLLDLIRASLDDKSG